MIRVYRVEHRGCGKGPWAAEVHGIGAYRLHMENGPVPDRHPNPYQEGAALYEAWSARSSGFYHFGFSSLEQLQEWFGCPHGRAAMAAEGYYLAVYEAPPETVHTGSMQVIFEKRQARLAELRCLVTFELEHGSAEVVAALDAGF